MVDLNTEDAELELEQYIKEWIKRHNVRNAVVIDILLRQIIGYHVKEIAKNEEGL